MNKGKQNSKTTKFDDSKVAPKKYNSSKSNKSYASNRSDRRPERPDYAEKGSNDPAWYGAQQELLRDSASIPYSWAVGTPVDLHIGLLPTTSTKKKIVVPGIQAIKLVPSVGLANTPQSPINVAAQSIYSFVRHANAGHSNYDSPDLMLYLTAMSQVYSYIVFLQRAYGVSSLYAQKNRYIPSALLKAMNINAEDVQSHQADFRYGINVLINKAASFAVPNDMSYFDRHAFLYSNIYTEGETIKDQMYMYTPAGFWQFKWNAATSAGGLDMKPFDKTLSTDKSGYKVQDLLDYGNEMLAELLIDEDSGIMSGDILKAYGTDKIVKLTPLTTEFPILPIPNKSVLEQMKNATIVGDGLATGFSYDYSVAQSTNKDYLISTPKVTLTNVNVTPWVCDAAYKSLKCLISDRLLTTNFADATPEITMENTRLCTAAKGYSYTAGSKAEITLITGSEFAVGCSFIRFDVSTNVTTDVDTLTYEEIPMRYYQPYLFGSAVAPIWGLNELTHLIIANNFKYHPASVVSGWTQNGTTATLADIVDYGTPVFQDVDNYAVMNTQDITRLHEAALLNELNVPSIARSFSAR